MLRLPPTSTLFPYTTLFRSCTCAPAATKSQGRATASTSSPCTSTKRSTRDRKSTRLNSSHVRISYAVFCLKKKNRKLRQRCGEGAQTRIRRSHHLRPEPGRL